LENPVALLLLMFTVPLFIHSLVPVKWVHRKNTLIGLLALLLLIANYTSSLFDLAKSFNDARIFIKDTLFLFILAYSWFILLHPYRNTDDVIQKQYLGRLIVLFGIFIPGIIADTFFLHYPMAKIFPIVYCTVGAFCLSYYYRSFSADSSKSNGTGLDGAARSIFPRATLVAKYDLTKRESEVIQLVNEGMTYNDIGETLFISVNTVKSHLRKSYQKLGIKNRLDLSRLINKLHYDHNSPSSSP
jgi:DNA-binding CsgD family transcriptional regulator